MRKLLFMIGIIAFAAGCADDAVVDEISDADQLAKDIITIDKWLTDNNITALTDPSGLRYRITTTGTGAKPTLTNTITVKYTGKYIRDGVTPANSVVFEQTGSSTATFKLSDLIKGWQIGFALLPKGSKATLYIPSGLGYGKKAAGSIAANSNLFFDVELIEVK